MSNVLQGKISGILDLTSEDKQKTTKGEPRPYERQWSSKDPESNKPLSKNKKSFTCNLCKYTTKSSGNLTRHRSCVHKNKKFCCSLCGKEFSQMYDLRQHECSIHNKCVTYVPNLSTTKVPFIDIWSWNMKDQQSTCVQFVEKSSMRKKAMSDIWTITWMWSHFHAPCATRALHTKIHLNDMQPFVEIQNLPRMLT